MLFNIILTLLFVASSVLFWKRICRKLPLLFTASDETITEVLHNDSKKWKLFILYFGSFYKEKFFRDGISNFVSKIFYRLHVLLLKADNLLVRILRKVRTHGKKEAVPVAVSSPELSKKEIKIAELQQEEVPVYVHIRKEERLKPILMSDVRSHLRQGSDGRISFVELTTSLRQKKSSAVRVTSVGLRKPRRKSLPELVSKDFGQR